MRRKLRLAVSGFVGTMVVAFYVGAVATLVQPVVWNHVLAWGLIFAPVVAVAAATFPE